MKPVEDVNEPDAVPRTIGVEEHFATPTVLGGTGRAVPEYDAFAAALLDLAEGRIAAMDRVGMGMQVLSLAPPGTEPLDPAEAVPVAREANDVLVAAVAARPDRLAGLAAVPTPAPDLAAAELERAVGAGLVGAMVNGHSQGRYLDDPMFEPLLATAERLDVPIYLHPTPPPPAVTATSYTGAFSADVAARFAGAGWGWHHETGTHALRMVLGGVFDRFPRLQVMLGHHGETVPMLVPRIERNFPTEFTGLDRSVREYLRENFFYTFGGWNWVSMLQAVQRLVGADRILFSTDHPFASMTEAHSFLGHLELDPADRELIAHGNAERLLGLDRTA